MAEGVENAAAICCFLTPKYQDSVACKEELTYAKEQGVRIIPIRLICDWKPTGWLGIAIAGRKWIDFRDIETNIDKIDQLILEIKNLVGQQMDCFNEIEPGNFDQNQQEACSSPASEYQNTEETHIPYAKCSLIH